MGRYDNLITGRVARLPGDLDLPPVATPAPVVGTRTPAPPRTGTVRNVITIVVPGKPIGKPRQTQSDRWKKRPAVMRYREWADRARAIAGALPPAEKVDELEIVAYFEPPASWSKKKRAASIGMRHRVKIDADNCLKAVMDAIWPDGDSAIADCRIRKFWDWDARVVIRITLS